MPPITCISEVVLNVTDLPSMRSFYAEVMGFPVQREVCLETETPDPTGEPTICFLKIADTDTPLGRDKHPQLLVLIDYRRHIYANRFDGHDVNKSTLNHLAFEVPASSYDAHLQRLRDLALHPVTTSFPALNARAIFFNDPAGNRLELICPE